MRVRQAQDRQRGVFAFRRAARGRVAGVAESVLPVHVGRVGRGVQQWRIAAGEHRNVVAAGHLAQLQRIGDGVAQADVAGGDGQADDVVGAVVERHQQGEGVVDAGIGVDQQGNLVGHGRIGVAAAR